MPLSKSNQFLVSPEPPLPLPSFINTLASFFLFAWLYFNIKSGRHGLPASVKMRISFAVILKEMDIRIFIKPFRRYALSSRTTNRGSPVIPKSVPLTNTFVMFLLL